MSKEPKKPAQPAPSKKIPESQAIGKIDPVKIPAEEALNGNEDIHLNDHKDWEKVRSDWNIRRYAERVFDTDDEFSIKSHVLLITVTIVILCFLLWASVAKLDELTRGQGRIIPSSEIQRLQSLEGGIVEEFTVREGDEVKAGQIVLRLRNVEASSDLGANQARALGLQATISRLQAEAEGKTTPEFSEDVMQGAPQQVSEEMNAFKANKEKIVGQKMVLEQQLAQREQEVREISTRISDLRGVLGVTREELAMVTPLVERGSAPKMELLQLDRQIKEQQSELNSAQSSLPRARSAVDEAKARLNELEQTAKAQAQTELSAKLIELSSLEQTNTALQDRKTRTDLRSPVDGIVKDILVATVGGVVRPGEDIIQIVPFDEQLLVEARIRPSDIAFIHPGQEATVKITAYDFSIYGGLKGEVVDISADTITDEEGEYFYRIRVRTFENALKRKGETLPIIPGMVASVDILTGEKTVLEYLLKPFIKTVDTAMHER